MIIKQCKKTETTKATMDLFVDSIVAKDINQLKSLLSEDGLFEIQSARLNTLEVDKKRFVSWIKKRLKEESELTVTFDQCLHCSIGAEVLLINDGTFPRQIKDSSERSKAGLMLESKDGLINKIRFCYVMVKTDNKYVFEVEIDRIKKYMDQGHSYWDAQNLADME